MGKKDSSGSTLTSSAPWGPTRKPLIKGIGDLSAYFNSGKGFKPYPGQTWVGMSPQTQTALDSISGTALGDTSGAQASNEWGSLLGQNAISTEGDFRGMMGQNPDALARYGTGIASGANGVDTGGYAAMLGMGPTALQDYAGGIASGADNIGTGGFSALSGTGPTALKDYTTGIASGANGLGTEGDLRTLLGNTSNPYFAGVVDKQASKLADDITRQFSGVGAYGGSGQLDALGTQVGDFRERAMADQWNQNNQMQRSLLGDITGVQSGNLANRMAAASGLSNEQQTNFGNEKSLQDTIASITGQNLSNRLGAAGALSGEQATGAQFNKSLQDAIAGLTGSNLDRSLAAAGALSGEQQTGFGNTRALLGDISNLQGTNYADRLSTLSQAPAIQGMQYVPGQQLASVGSAYDDLATRKKQAQIDQFNAKQDQQKNRLAWYMSALGGPAGMGTTTSSTVTPPSNPWGAALGGGLLGAQVAPPGATGWGALLGGAGGFLSQLLSDKRAKTDIHRVGKTEGGSVIYRYRYKFGGPAMLGVMAQEEKKRNPRAVVTLPSGLLAVDYRKVA